MGAHLARRSPRRAFGSGGIEGVFIPHWGTFRLPGRLARQADQRLKRAGSLLDVHLQVAVAAIGLWNELGKAILFDYHLTRFGERKVLWTVG